MKKQIIIGDHVFKFKKDALNHFKVILNSYNFGEELNENDQKDVLELLKLHPNFEEKKNDGIRGFQVDKVKKYNAKCFHIIKNDLSLEAFSYTKCINGSHSPSTKFSRTCRDVIQSDLRDVKRKYFGKKSKKGQVKCQETGELCFWEELVIDHRQPNTFSVIIDRFIEVYKIDIKTTEYVEKLDNVYEFKDGKIAEEFREYHKQKANLRIIKKGKNAGRAHQARVKQQKKDLKIK